MKNHFGKCALCGKECELTFEHVPPRAAFNSTPARPVSGNEIFKEEVINDKERMPWDTEGLKYQNQQQGMADIVCARNVITTLVVGMVMHISHLPVLLILQ